MATDLAIRIATVMDAAGLNKADKGIQKLEGSAKKLGKTLGLALGTAAIVGFGKASVKAFMDDQRAAATLANAVKNLGMEMSQPEIDKFIANLEKTVGIVDEKLRPAFQTLITSTKDLAASQQLLGLATEVSRGSGQDLATVAQDLANAYVGNVKGLKKYNLGLSAAELKTKSFAQITELLNNQFTGSNAAYLKTYAGQMEVLAVAADNAKEVIGKGLVDAFVKVTGSLDVQDLSTKIAGLAANLADMFVKVGNLIGQNIAFIKDLGIAIVAVFTATKVYAGVAALLTVLTKITKAFKLMREVSIGAAIAEMAAINPVAALVGGAALVGTIIAATKLIDKLTTKSKSNKLTLPSFSGLDDPKYKKSVADKIKQDKANARKDAASKKAALVFDINAIQLVAALKGNLNEEERKRAEAQLALLVGNDDLATKLTNQILAANDATGQLAKFLTTLPDANNPFAYLDEWIKNFKANIASINFPTPSSVTTNVPRTDVGGHVIGTEVPGFTPPPYVAPPAPVINIVNNGSVIHENQLIDQIMAGTQLSSLSGSPSQIGRIAGMFG